MKNLIFGLSTYLMGTILFSQGVEELFYMLPDEFSYGIKLEDRKVLMKDSSVFIDNGGMFELKTLDRKNGYLELFVAWQCSKWEMCYWSYGDGGRMVAVNLPNGCYTGLHFFQLNNGKLQYYFNRTMNELTAYHFFRKDLKIDEVSVEKGCIDFELPRKGVNIVCRLGSFCDETGNKKLLRGDKFDLIWDKGNFKIGEPYF